MDKSIKIAVLVAAVVSITAALLWDRIVAVPKKEIKQKSEKKTMPTREAVEYQLVGEIINTPYRNGKTHTNYKPTKQSKPTAYNPARIKNKQNANYSKTQIKTHIVKRGDSLAKISKLYYGTEKYWTYLKKFNHLQTTNLSIGQKLRIPAKPK